MGISSTASQPGATALGISTVASAVGTLATGYNTKASGNFSTALGFYTTAKSYAATAIGWNNVGLVSAASASQPPGSVAWVNTDPLLEIGNGTNAPSDAVTVFKNGNLRAAGTIESPSGVRIPPSGNLSMGVYTSGNSPTNLCGTNGLLYPDGN